MFASVFAIRASASPTPASAMFSAWRMRWSLPARPRLRLAPAMSTSPSSVITSRISMEMTSAMPRSLRSGTPISGWFPMSADEHDDGARRRAGLDTGREVGEVRRRGRDRVEAEVEVARSDRRHHVHHCAGRRVRAGTDDAGVQVVDAHAAAEADRGRARAHGDVAARAATVVTGRDALGDAAGVDRADDAEAPQRREARVPDLPDVALRRAALAADEDVLPAVAVGVHGRDARRRAAAERHR